MADLRDSQAVIEAVVQPTPDLRDSQAVIETLIAGVPELRVSQSVIEVLISTTGGERSEVFVW